MDSSSEVNKRAADADREAGAETHVIPLAEEVLRIRKQARETGSVRIDKRVEERVEVIDEPLHRRQVHVQRVPVDRVVDAPPPIRQEGATTIIPVVEERLVLRKQLVLVEEVHVTQQDSTYRDPQEITLRRETIDVHRHAPDQPSGPASEPPVSASENSASEREGSSLVNRPPNDRK